MRDIFDKIKHNRGPLGQHAKESHGYFTFPKLEGEIAPIMKFRGKDVLTWSINNYLGLSNLPEVRKVDADASRDWGLGYPMGARMMSGQTKEHEQLERELAEFMDKEAGYLLNFGYQGCMSSIEALVGRNDVIVYDSESHACMIDGVRLHQGKRKVFLHNDMESFDKQMAIATKLVEQSGGGILVVTEGVFGMSGDQGKLKEIIEFRKSGKYDFRLFVDDAHGFGTLGDKGQGAGEFQGVQDEIDVLFGTFAKSMASVGAFVCSTEDVINYLAYNMRSQIFAKSLPMPLVIGALKRLELLKAKEQRDAAVKAAEKAQETAKKAQETANSIADQTSKAAKEAAEKAQEAAKEAKEAAQKASEASRSYEFIKGWLESTENSIKELQKTQGVNENYNSLDNIYNNSIAAKNINKVSQKDFEKLDGLAARLI